MRITALKVPVSKLDPDKNNDVPSVGVAVDVLGNSPSQFRWSTGNSVKVVSRTFSNGENDKLLALDQKEIILHYVNSDFINLPKRIGSQSFPQAPNLGNSLGEGNADRRSIIEKAIESSDIIINTDYELLEFLKSAKFGTFGFFRIGPASSTSMSLSTGDSEDGYLLLLTPYEFSINRKFSISQTGSSSKNNP